MGLRHASTGRALLGASALALVVSSVLGAMAACSAFAGHDTTADTNDAGVTGEGGSATELCPPDEVDAGGATQLVCDGSALPVDITGSAKHCGSCSRDCLDDQCLQGRCKPVDYLAAEAPTYPPAQLTAWDSDNVYWVHESAVRKMGRKQVGVPVLLGMRTIEAGNNEAYLDEVKVDQNFAFIRAQDGVFRTPLGGGGAELKPLRIDGYANINGFALDDAYIYSTSVSSGKILRMGKDGSGSKDLVIGRRPLGPLAADGTSIFWLEAAAPDSGTGAAVVRTDLQGGDVSFVVQGLTAPMAMVVNGAYVYWADGVSGTISRAPKQGGGIPTLLSTTPAPSKVAALAVDDLHVYWLATDPNAPSVSNLFKASKCGGGTTLLAASIQATSFVVDDTHLFVSQYERPFLRIAK